MLAYSINNPFLLLPANRPKMAFGTEVITGGSSRHDARVACIKPSAIADANAVFRDVGVGGPAIAFEYVSALNDLNAV